MSSARVFVRDSISLTSVDFAFDDEARLLDEASGARTASAELDECDVPCCRSEAEPNGMAAGDGISSSDSLIDERR